MTGRPSPDLEFYDGAARGIARRRVTQNRAGPPYFAPSPSPSVGLLRRSIPDSSRNPRATVGRL